MRGSDEDIQLIWILEYLSDKYEIPTQFCNKNGIISSVKGCYYIQFHILGNVTKICVEKTQITEFHDTIGQVDRN